ncbi:MAG: hypothetical protein O3B31_02205 [Chloroflexi bacterium]|nr:hypothetical protein [Chloroflexota bacterium]MDA1002154.1 hypothetical protein [Chloroflexota bacterium]
MTVSGPIPTPAGVAAAVAAGPLAIAWLSASPDVVHACSPGPEANAFVDSEIIVAGRVRAMDLVTFSGVMRFITVDLTIDVDRYLKGAGPGVLVARDDRSVEPGLGQARTSTELATLAIEDVDRDALLFSAGDGACGAIYSDPIGQYWVAGLTRAPDGSWRPSGPTMFGVAEGRDAPAIVAALARVAEQARRAGAVVEPAHTGDAGLGRTGGGASVAVVATALASALLIVIAARVHSRPRGTG